jgi:tripartite-type tricarboxylate transporter receptor subunit TctC
VPAKTPHETVMKLSETANKILKKPEVIERFRSVGSEPAGGTPEEIEKFFAAERVSWKRAVEVAHLQKM